MQGYRLDETQGPKELARQYAHYYDGIAEPCPRQPAHGLTRYRLRPEIGEGTIEVNELMEGVRAIRYDVEFAAEHRLEYRFAADRFELEYCLDGRMHIAEDIAGRADFVARSVSMGPARRTNGVVVHRERERYRAVSVVGSRALLAPYFGSLGLPAFEAAGASLPARTRNDQYLGRCRALHPASRPLEAIFFHRRLSAGRSLFMESQVMAAFAAVTDTMAPEAPGARPRLSVADLAAHETEALRGVPAALWDRRHSLPSSAELARSVGMPTRRFAEGFTLLFGKPLLEFHRDACLAYATELLVDTDWTTARIGCDVGYSTPSGFSYAFRRTYGCTPHEYRVAHRQPESGMTTA